MLYRAGRKSSKSTELDKVLLNIGFTLIALFEGFIIVGGLNSGVPGWLVALGNPWSISRSLDHWFRTARLLNLCIQIYLFQKLLPVQTRSTNL
jgi:hypothetical protein